MPLCREGTLPSSPQLCLLISRAPTDRPLHPRSEPGRTSLSAAPLHSAAPGQLQHSMLSRQLAAEAPQWLRVAAAGARGAAAKAGSSGAVAAVKPSDDGITTTVPGQAFVGDLRSTSALEVGDGVFNHTKKWLQVSCLGGGVVVAPTRRGARAVQGAS